MSTSMARCAVRRFGSNSLMAYLRDPCRENFSVYPVVNGKLIDPVLLKYLEYSPHNANLAANVSTMAPSEANELAGRSSEFFQQEEPHYLSHESQKTNTGLSNYGPSGLPILQSSEESCWMFEDEDGRKHGPHFLAKLYYWHHSNYLHDSLMVAPEVKEVLDTFCVAAELRSDSLGAYVISMASNASDVLVVELL